MKSKPLTTGKPAAGHQRQGVPYTMLLSDGRTLYVDVPADMVQADRSGQTAFTPAGVAFLDRIRALAVREPQSPPPAYVATVRHALGWSQAELAQEIGKDKLTISRWERGVMRPGRQSVATLNAVLRRVKARGVVVKNER